MLEFIDIFATQAKEFGVEMQDLYNNKKYDSLGQLAHKAKSSVAIMGMSPLSKRLKDLEIYCADGKNVEVYQEIISNFKSECSLAIQELQDYKKNHPVKKNNNHAENRKYK